MAPRFSGESETTAESHYTVRDFDRCCAAFYGEKCVFERFSVLDVIRVLFPLPDLSLPVQPCFPDSISIGDSCPPPISDLAPADDQQPLTAAESAPAAPVLTLCYSNLCLLQP